MAVLLVLTFRAGHTAAYSVLTHEELIDLAWNDSIRPLLLKRFPGATEEQLRVAHAYAYGGSAIQDMNREESFIVFELAPGHQSGVILRGLE